MSEDIKFGSQAWSDWIKTLFTPDEVYEENLYTVDSFARVFQEYVGTIVDEKPIKYDVDYANNKVAYCQYEMTVLVNGDVKTYGAVGECNIENRNDDFSHILSTAETRARGRALKKALGIYNSLTKEELDNGKRKKKGKEKSDNLTPTKVEKNQVGMINRSIEKLGINPEKFLSSFGAKDINIIEYDVATSIIAQLNAYKTKKEEIPTEFLTKEQ